MVGETNLDVLLQSMEPELVDGEFVFVTLKSKSYGDAADLEPIGMFSEQEGMTLIVPKLKAQAAKVEFESVFKCITLTVHSSLDAVGLTAAFANKLAEYDISANVVAGYYHDHIFVQTQHAEQAIKALKEFSAK